MPATRIKAIILTGLLAAVPSAVYADSISAPDLSARLDGNDAPLVLDVRTKREYEAGHVPGALNVPHTELPARLPDLSAGKGEEIVVYCEVGGRADTAGDVLEEAGFTSVRALEGHMANWRAQGYPTE